MFYSFWIDYQSTFMMAVSKYVIGGATWLFARPGMIRLREESLLQQFQWAWVSWHWVVKRNIFRQADVLKYCVKWLKTNLNGTNFFCRKWRLCFMYMLWFKKRGGGEIYASSAPCFCHLWYLSYVVNYTRMTNFMDFVGVYHWLT